MHAKSSRTAFIWVIFAAGILGGACSPETASSRTPSVSVKDSAGVEIVTNVAPDTDADFGWSLADTPSLVIGERDGSDPAFQFSRIGSALRLIDGRIVILEIQAAELRWFDSMGGTS